MLTESELQDQHLFVRVFEHAPIGMIIGSPNGEFSKVNKSFCNMMGYSEEELTNLSYQEITHPDDLEVCQSTFQKLLQGQLESYQHEKRYIHKSGKILSAILSVSLVLDEYGKPSFFISQVVDITEQKMKEEELKKIEELHNLISEHSLDMIIRFTSQGILTYVSPAASRHLGYEPEELIGKNGYDLWHPEDRDIWLERGNQESRKIVYRIRHKNGHYVWQESLAKKIRDDDGRVLYAIAVCRDVTERMNMELKLQEIEQCHESLIRYTPVGICSLNKSGQFIDVNPAYERITGYSREEMVQMTFKDIIFPEMFQSGLNNFNKAFEGKLMDVETYIKNKNGNRVDIVVSSSPIVIDGEITGINVIAKDITNQKQTEELIRRSEKLSVIGELAAGIAHEIRNPLTSLRGFVQLFQEEDKSGAKKLYYNVMLSEIDRINEIASELLVLAKPSKETISHGNISDKLNEVIRLLEGQANLYNVVIQKELENNLPLIECQSTLKQVFINLLKNSIESMMYHGGEVLIQANKKAGALFIRFVDQGCGIPQEQLSKIGQPFFTTKETGTGLGLMVSQRIIQNHKGTMRIESEVGRGTTVEITLPVITT